jgi:hypothetical protein
LNNQTIELFILGNSFETHTEKERNNHLCDLNLLSFQSRKRLILSPSDLLENEEGTEELK